MIETNDAARPQAALRRDARSVAAAGTKPQGNAAHDHDASQSAEAEGVKAERNRRYENNACFFCGKYIHKRWDCPQSQQSKAGKCVHGKNHGHAPKQQQQSTSGSDTTGPAVASRYSLPN